MSAVIAEDVPAPAGTETPLAAHVAHEGGRVVVRLRGALSGPRVPLLESVLYRLERRGRGRLTLDLRALDAIDAAGAAMVHRSVERVLHVGRSISVLGDDVATRPGDPCRHGGDVTSFSTYLSPDEARGGMVGDADLIEQLAATAGPGNA